MAFIEIIDEEERISRKFEDSLIQFRRLDAETADRIEKRYRRERQTTNYERQIPAHPPGEGAGVDEAERRKDLIDYIILSWENVLHPVTKLPVPCTRENKIKLPQKILAEILSEAMRFHTQEATMEEQLKNFGTT